MSPLKRPIFVVGCPRSGTTLVQCILSASSHAFSLPETHFFSEVAPDLLGRPDLSALDDFIEQVEAHRPGTDTARSLRAVEKTPRHVLHLDTIDACFPDARFINVVRDPIDVASSLRGVPWEPSRSVISLAQRWTESVLAARDYATRHPDRMLTVVYEVLVREPEATTRALCDFLDLPYEEAMLEEFGREAARNVAHGETWKRDIENGVLLDRRGIWRERLSPGQGWLVAHSTAQMRREYGFGDVPTAGAFSIGSAVLSELRVRFREARASSGFVGSARYAGSVFRALAPT